MALLAWALFAPASLRRVIGSRGFVVAGGIAFPTVTLVALLAYSLGVSRALVLPREEQPLRIEIVARQYWWEVRYPDAGEGAVTANQIHIPAGREVELLLSSGDVIHSVWIPNLHGKMDMIPGRVNRQRFVAERTGTLRGQCTEFCGLQHALMAFWVVVQEPAEFDAWLARQQAPVPEPADAVSARGMQVFGQAGCGACHAVRGTEWQGRLGPDLSRIGSRLSLAAGALENHRGTLAGWIAARRTSSRATPCPPTGAPSRARTCWRWRPGSRGCADGHCRPARGGRDAQPAAPPAGGAGAAGGRLAHAARPRAADRVQQQPHRPALRRHRAAVLRAGRRARPHHPRAACLPGPDAGGPGDLQPGLHHARHGDDVPLRRAGGGGGGDHPAAGHARHAGTALPAPRRLRLPDLRDGRAALLLLALLRAAPDGGWFMYRR
jgi:cytochrome c oxidase subunit 2